MSIVFGVLILLGTGSALVFEFIYPKKQFGIMALGGLVFFGLISLAFIFKSVLAVSVFGLLSLACYAAIGSRAAMRFKTAGAIVSTHTPETVALPPPRAKKMWLAQSVCAAAMVIGILGIAVPRLIEGFPPQSVKQRVEIVDTTLIFPHINVDPKSDMNWPNPEIKQKAGENSWGSWRPKLGERGSVAFEAHDRNHEYVIVMIGEHYVVVAVTGVKYLSGTE